MKPSREAETGIVFKLGALCAVFILVPLCSVVGLAFGVYTHSARELAEDYAERAARSSAAAIEQYIENMSEQMGTVYQQHSTFGFLYPTVLDHLSSASLSGLDSSKKSLVLNNYLESLIKFQPEYIFNAFLVDMQGECYYAANRRMTSSRNYDYDFLSQPWFNEIAESASPKIQVYLSDESKEQYLYRPPGRTLVLFARNVYDVNAKLKTRRVATLFVSVDAAFLCAYLEPQEMAAQTFHVLDADGRIVYTAGGLEKSPDYFGELAGLEEWRGETGSGHKRLSVFSRLCPKLGWYVVCETDRERLTSGIYRIQGIILLSIAAVGLFSLLAFRQLCRLTAKPVRVILGNMKQIEEGRLEGFAPLHTRDEFGRINRGLIEMAANLDRYIQRSYVAELRRRQADLYALQSQIRPHFIMNALESIRMHLVERGDPETAHAVRLFGQIVGAALGGPVREITVREEVAFIRKYMEFQCYRFGDRIRLQVNLPDTLLSLPILRLLLEPLVENSIKHGLAQAGHEGLITLNGYLAGEEYRLMVIDNGCGISPQALEALQKRLESPGAALEGRHVGLVNVQRRIRECYGDGYGLTLQSIPGQGTIVELRLPAGKGEADGTAACPDCGR